MLTKEQEFLLKRANLFKNNFRQPFNIQDFLTPSKEPIIEDLTSSTKTNILQIQNDSNSSRFDETVHEQNLIDDDDDDEERSTKSPSVEHDRRTSLYFKDGIRFNPMSVCSETLTKKKSPSSSTSSSPLLLKPIPESLLLQETIEEETKCVVCNATFPSVWLLEQHAALQHANLGPMEEKPFICDQCGQSYRYRSAYVKHREQNHRARLPADKLFTCDVCGMQFRYLKSFKKHRLNHALERLHGKNERRNAESGSELVSSSNETLTVADEIAELQFAIKTEEEDEDQDDTIDSPTVMCVDQQNSIVEEHHAKITSSETETYVTAAAGAPVIAAAAAASAISYNTNDARNFILKVVFNFNKIIIF